MKDDTYFHYKNQYENVWSQYQQHQIAAIFGAAYDTRIDDRLVSVELQYRRGINDLNNEQLLLSTTTIEGGEENSSSSSNGQSGKIFISTLSFNIAISIF
jgi:hypothetical protein